jgi:hypothetical protein
MQKVDTQPEGPGGTGKEKTSSEGAEVAGRGRDILYTCWNDGAGNYINTDWKWWTCWRCGTIYTF